MLRALYRRRNLYTGLGILSMLSPLPGVALGLFIQAKCVDNDIKQAALKMEAEK